MGPGLVRAVLFALLGHRWALNGKLLRWHLSSPIAPLCFSWIVSVNLKPTKHTHAMPFFFCISLFDVIPRSTVSHRGSALDELLALPHNKTIHSRRVRTRLLFHFGTLPGEGVVGDWVLDWNLPQGVLGQRPGFRLKILLGNALRQPDFFPAPGWVGWDPSPSPSFKKPGQNRSL